MSGKRDVEQITERQNGPLVSVIMNCLNGEEFLREAIDSVYEQTYGLTAEGGLPEQGSEVRLHTPRPVKVRSATHDRTHVPPTMRLEEMGRGPGADFALTTARINRGILIERTPLGRSNQVEIVEHNQSCFGASRRGDEVLHESGHQGGPIRRAVGRVDAMIHRRSPGGSL